MHNRIKSFLDCPKLLYKINMDCVRNVLRFIQPCTCLINVLITIIQIHVNILFQFFFCDLTKAFDVIDHDIPVKKLHVYCMREIV